jgi:3-deoxy-manno-octulosonate cytidylyltransferase (CMP-KDO synthetase)
MQNKVLIVLPCRLKSTRLKEKHLIELSNWETIFEMTYKLCIKSKADKVLIATDDTKIFLRAKKFTKDVIMTSKNHKTWTDRVAEVAKKFKEYKIILIIQWDEPLINVKVINNLIDNIVNSDKKIVMSTVVTNFKSINDLKDSNIVKVVIDKNNNALYFSRSIIPYNRNAQLNLKNYLKHLWLYAYKRDFLLKYTKMKQTYMEKLEKLEQLRILENGYKINIIKTSLDGLWINTKEDLDKLEKILKSKKTYFIY